MNAFRVVCCGIIFLLTNTVTRASINRVIPNMHYTRSACDGEDLNLECPKGFFIQFDEATYGRSNAEACIPEGSEPVTSDQIPCVVDLLDAPTLTSCNTQDTCQLNVSSELGDPCPGSTFSKSLNVSFTCIKSDLTRYACEEDTLSLFCPEGEVIQVIDVLYGTSNDDRCNKDQEFTECYSPDAGFRVSELCNHKASCQLQAGASMFGDPCPDNKKILDVNYQCATCANEDGDDEKCDNYALRGECESNPPWMMAWCRKACWRCDLTWSCGDLSGTEQCTHWASIGECHNNRDWMRTNCQFSCNKCHETATLGDDGGQRWDEAPEHRHEPEDAERKDEEPEELKDVRNRSKRSSDADDLPLQKYYSVIAIGATVVVMSAMLVWVSFRNKEEKPYKKSA